MGPIGFGGSGIHPSGPPLKPNGLIRVENFPVLIERGDNTSMLAIKTMLKPKWKYIVQQRAAKQIAKLSRGKTIDRSHVKASCPKKLSARWLLLMGNQPNVRITIYILHIF